MIVISIGLGQADKRATGLSISLSRREHLRLAVCWGVVLAFVARDREREKERESQCDSSLLSLSFFLAPSQFHALEVHLCLMSLDCNKH